MLSGLLNSVPYLDLSMKDSNSLPVNLAKEKSQKHLVQFRSLKLRWTRNSILSNKMALYVLACRLNTITQTEGMECTPFHRTGRLG